MTPDRRLYEREAHERGHMKADALCPECWEPIGLEDWNDRHDHDESVWGCHPLCCPDCNGSDAA